VSKANAFRVGAVAIIIFGACAAVGSYQLSLGSLSAPGSGLWPFIVAIVLILSGAVLAFVDTPDDYERWTRRSVKTGAAVAALAAFIVAFSVLSFLPAAFLMLALWLRFFSGEPWKLAIPLALAGAVVLHAVFQLWLGVPFPEGLLAKLTGIEVGL
jgi:putative tricarboxylic transport membrane protein